MKRLFLMLSLIITISLSAQDVQKMMLSPEIDAALEQINMTRDDLTFNFYRDQKDAFRLSYIDNLFQNPLDTFTISDSIANKLWQNEAFIQDLNLKELFQFTWQMIDVGTVESSREDKLILNKKQAKQVKKLSKAHQDIIEYVLSMKAVENEFRQAFSSLNQDDINLIKEYFINEDNEDREPIDYLDLKKLKDYTVQANETTRSVYKLIEKVKFEHMANAAFILQDIINEVHQIISFNLEDKSKSEIIEINTELGTICINPPTEYNLDNALFVIDYQSHNIYKQTQNNPLLVLMDYYGNDRYEGSAYSQGGVFMGLQVFVDFTGDDYYLAGSNSQGAACLGLGALIDFEGNDYYNAEAVVQGAGKLGIGILYDISGNDQYFCSLYGQGFGYTKGFGALVDINGSDTYIVKKSREDWLRYDSHFESLSQGCGLGIRPYYSGGTGVLVDKNGNDTYISDIYGQGTAYWYALGALVDGSGHDQYISYQYAQGAGIHLAFGALIDYEGDDFYKSNGVSQGCGHDLAFGGLLDIKGNDNYICYGLSQGGGNANAISFFMDYSGDDGYIAKDTNTMGYSDLRRSYGYIGLFLDLNGKDQYGSPHGANNSSWIHSYYGVGVDKESLSKEEAKELARPDAKPADIELSDDLELLFLQASAQAEALSHLVKPARERLIEMGEEAIPYLLEQLDTDLVREQLTLMETLPRMGSIAYPFFEQALNSGENTSFLISLIGLTGSPDAFYLIEPFMNQENPNYYLAVRACGDLKNQQAIPFLIQMLKDESVAVRREAAIALQKLPSKLAFAALIDCLDDPYQEVRYSAEIALKKIDSIKVSELKTELNRATGLKRKHLLRIIDEKKPTY